MSPDEAERARRLMMSALDGEAAPADRAELERLLAADPALAAEWARLERIKAITASAAPARPPEEVWDRYWTDVARRIERGTAWIFVSAGALLLLSCAAVAAVQWLLSGSDLPLAARGGIAALAAGGTLLAASVAREKWAMRRNDPYRRVKR